MTEGPSEGRGRLHTKSDRFPKRSTGLKRPRQEMPACTRVHCCQAHHHHPTYHPPPPLSSKDGAVAAQHLVKMTMARPPSPYSGPRHCPHSSTRSPHTSILRSDPQGCDSSLPYPLPLSLPFCCSEKDKALRRKVISFSGWLWCGRSSFYTGSDVDASHMRVRCRQDYEQKK